MWNADVLTILNTIPKTHSYKSTKFIHLLYVCISLFYKVGLFFDQFTRLLVICFQLISTLVVANIGFLTYSYIQTFPRPLRDIFAVSLYIPLTFPPVFKLMRAVHSKSFVVPRFLSTVFHVVLIQCSSLNNLKLISHNTHNILPPIIMHW